MNPLHILNPSRKFRGEVHRFFDKRPAGSYVWIERTSHPTHLETVIEWALNEGEDFIAVWGGDGTFNRAVRALQNFNALSKVNLMLVPVGTCNDFARKIGLAPWRDQLTLLEQGKGQARAFDIGLLEHAFAKRPFLNNAGFGRTRGALERRKSNPIADILDFKDTEINIEWETAEGFQIETRRVFLGMVCNAPYFSGGLYFMRDVEPDDGMLSAFFVPAMSRSSLFLKFIKARWGRPLSDSKIQRIDAARIRIQAKDDLYPQADGEVTTMEPVRSVEFSILPGAVRIWINS